MYTQLHNRLFGFPTQIYGSVLGMESMPITSMMGCSKMPGRSIDSWVPQGTERCESPKNLPQNTYMFFGIKSLRWKIHWWLCVYIYIYIHIVILAFFQLWETSLIKRRSAIVFFLLLLRPFGLQWTCNCGTSVFRWPDVLWGASLSDGKGNDFIWHEKQASTTNKKTYIWKKSHSSMNIFWVIHLL